MGRGRPPQFAPPLARPPLRGGPSPAQAFAQGVEAQKAGRLAEAERHFRAVLAQHPNHGDSLHLLGLISIQQGRFKPAVDLLTRAVAADPRSPQFHNNLGHAQRGLGRLADAEASFRTAISLRPDYPKALSNLGQTLAALRRPAEAVEPLAQAIEMQPADVDAVEAIAGVLYALGRTGEGLAALRRLTELEPGSAERWHALALALEQDAQLSEAIGAYREAIRLQPTFAGAHNGLGNALAYVGRLHESVAAYRESLRLAPDHLSARSNLIMTLHSLPEVTAEDILQEARAYGARVEAKHAPKLSNTREPERRLRIGYVSADFREHPVGHFLDRVLPAHSEAVETILYSDVRFPDAETERLRASAAHWRETGQLSDVEVAKMVRGDRIDILVDLAGHTGHNRLGVFGMRAAPVQASWLGYFGTTGLSSMDYVVGDDVVLPSGDEAVFTEAPVRLDPPYLCWSPPETAVPVAPFPALTTGFVTFGCFNNRAKINPETVAAWARILGAVEGSRLFLKSWSLADAGCREDLASAFASHRIAPERLIFEGLTPRADALAAYNRVDIALDPFPFGGCTTTADTLWMGVPVVTLAGERWSGRMSRTILKTVGLEAWVAPDLDAYVETAIRLARDVASLAPVRAGLRERLESSSFCDGPGFARRLEAAYRDMWRRWCSSAKA